MITWYVLKTLIILTIAIIVIIAYIGGVVSLCDWIVNGSKIRYTDPAYFMGFFIPIVAVAFPLSIILTLLEVFK